MIDTGKNVISATFISRNNINVNININISDSFHDPSYSIFVTDIMINMIMIIKFIDTLTILHSKLTSLLSSLSSLLLL